MKTKKRYIPLIVTVLVCVAVVAVLLIWMKNDSQKVTSAQNQKAIKGLFQEKQEIVIDCLGDSITWGQYSSADLQESIESGETYVGLDDGGQLFEEFDIYVSSAYQSDPTYPEVLEAQLNSKLKENGLSNTVTVVNDGVSGDWITNKTYQRMTCDPDIVILLMGGNNFYFDFPIPGMFEANINALKEQGKIVYLVNYPLYTEGQHIQAFSDANDYIASMAEKEKLPLIDLETFFKQIQKKSALSEKYGTYEIKELFSPDHIHLSEKGYELIGTYITDKLYSDIAS